ncbi:MAG: FkbM family methyltransferase [Bacteroidota bacterium]
MIHDLKQFLKGGKNNFYQFCRINLLELDYEINKNEFALLKSIFQEREYADYFPFYKDVTIIDIGAHYGYFSLFAGINSGSKSKIIAIEPSKNNFQNLEKNIASSGNKNIRAINCAVDTADGTTQLFSGKSINYSLVKSYSLLNDGQPQTVTTKKLETIIKENNIDTIDFLKMDCEGAEYGILESTPSYIYDKITTISMEFHDLKDVNCTGEVIIRKLTEMKFRIVKYAYGATNMNQNYGKIIGTRN